MKNFITISILLFPCLAWGQVVQKGDIELHLGTGFAVYGLNHNGENADSNNVAVSGLIGLSGQYAITKNYSLGLAYERNGFATNADSSEAARSNAVFILNRYRLLNKEKFVLQLSGDLGFSSFRYSNQEDKVSGGGLGLKLGLDNLHYFGGKFALTYGLGFATYRYDELKTDKSVVLKGHNTNDNFYIGMNGLNVRVGLVFKIKTKQV